MVCYESTSTYERLIMEYFWLSKMHLTLLTWKPSEVPFLAQSRNSEICLVVLDAYLWLCHTLPPFHTYPMMDEGSHI